MVRYMKVRPVRKNVKLYEDKYIVYDPARPFTGRRDVKTIIAETFLGVDPRYGDIDPLVTFGADMVGIFMREHFSCPTGSELWEKDPSPDCTTTDVSFQNCEVGDYCGPILLVLNSTVPRFTTTFRDSVATYAVPSVKASQAPCNKTMTRTDNSVIPQIPGGLKLKGTSCTDVDNAAIFNSFSARDDSTRTYTIAALALGFINPYADFFQGWAYFNLPSAQSKSASDIIYYIYRIGFYYG